MKYLDVTNNEKIDASNRTQAKMNCRTDCYEIREMLDGQIMAKTTYSDGYWRGWREFD